MRPGNDTVDVQGPEVHDQGFWVVIVVFISIALYNVVELNFLIASTFKQFRGLYFWSLVVATWGVAFNAVGYLLRLVQIDPSGFAHSTVLLVGWCAMVTGQSLVLYSRLHFVLHHPTLLRYVLTMIITNAIWLGVPVIVLVYGTNSTKPGPFMTPYSIFEKLQLCVFSAQELIISSLYIFETARMLKARKGVAPAGPRRILSHLILVNIFIVLLDVSILALEFTEQYNIQTAWKPVVYSVKLKVEFSVLNRLVEFSQHMRAGSSLRPMTGDTGTIVAPESTSTSAPVTPTVADFKNSTAESPRDKAF